MPTIRDLVGAIRQRAGVDAAVVLGRDGLLIDSQSRGEFEAEHVAAHLPAVVAAADEFGAAADRGQLATAVLEHERGLCVVSALSRDALLLVVLGPDADVAQLLFDLRRARSQIASLV